MTSRQSMRSHNASPTCFKCTKAHQTPIPAVKHTACSLNPAGYRQTSGRHACNITERLRPQLHSDVLWHVDKQLTARAKQQLKYGGERPKEWLQQLLMTRCHSVSSVLYFTHTLFFSGWSLSVMSLYSMSKREMPSCLNKGISTISARLYKKNNTLATYQKLKLLLLKIKILRMWN